MAKFTDLPQIAQIGIVVAVAAAGAMGFWVMKTKPIQDANARDLATLKTKTAEVAQLSPYENKLAELNRQIESLKQQLDLQKRIVPDEKEVPSFITVMQAEALKSNIEIRRYTLKPTVAHEFYTEQPVDVDVDGSYYSVLDFFQRLSQADRIININGLTMAGLKGKGSAKNIKTYHWGPNETVAVNCTATTFYSTPESAKPATPAKGAGPAKGATK